MPSFDFYAFNIGDYYGAVEKVGSEPSPRCCTPTTAPTKAGVCA